MDAEERLRVLGGASLDVFRQFSAEPRKWIFHAILEREPESAARVNPELPAALDGIISKSLEKNFKLRYQTARDLGGFEEVEERYGFCVGRRRSNLRTNPTFSATTTA